MNNKHIGNEYEKKFMDLLASKGFWVHFVSDRLGGQCCDIIAAKENTIYLFDVKHCSEDKFYFKNIQPNQLSCFALALEKKNYNCGFMIYFDSIADFRFYSYYQIKHDLEEYKTFIRIEECDKLCVLK